MAMIDEVLNPPVEKFSELKYEEIQKLLLAKPTAEGTYITTAQGDILVSMNMQTALEEWLDSGAAREDQLLPRGLLQADTLNQERPGDGTTYRWPADPIDSETDYVFFQFGRYKPPFNKDVGELRRLSGLNEKDYNLKNARDVADKIRAVSTTSATYEMYRDLELLDPLPVNIMLPIPQDLSNEIQAQWQGKQFTATGRAAVAALGAGNFSYANEVVNNIAGNAKALQKALATSVLNSIPGVGGNIEFNDVSGSTSGIVINPNAELLYDSPEMRELGMIFKMVPQNEKDSETIRSIITTFREAALPRWGDVNGSGSKLISGQESSTNTRKDGVARTNPKRQFDLGSKDNWIQVPDLCKFTFMHGGDPHPFLIQYKPCAIQAVEVNYTPDGTYSTYRDGAPTAVELRLNFMETKLVYADEVSKGY
tara:strand:- start:260 stop:1531 length:1272 start_codon:yes stop_codon:yes gene_type:complete